MTTKIFLPKWVYILAYSENNNISNISKKAHCGYDITINLIKDMEKRGWLFTEKQNRQRKVYIKEKGLAIYEKVKWLLKEIGEFHDYDNE